MGRIRSIHPGFFTDENYMVLSMAARAALPGIWTECDDAGVFEWKPIVLKAKLFPADNVDMAEILSELSEQGWLKRIEVDGRPYGLARNFRKFQRPEKPKCRFPLPEEHRVYVGLKPTDPQPVTDESPTDPGISPQMEEGGGRMEVEKEESEKTARASDPAHWAESQAILKDHSEDVDDWELDFLHSIKWKPTLTKPQRDSLKAIQSKISTKGAPTATLPSVRRGSPQYDAWLEYYRKRGKAKFFETLDAITVPTDFPPQEVAA